MSTMTEDKCFRCRDDCTPIAYISADQENGSFTCVGYNRIDTRFVKQDRFTLCWKNDVIDKRGQWSRRDLLDTQCVIAQALSTDENVRVNEELTDDQMNDINLI